MKRLSVPGSPPTNRRTHLHIPNMYRRSSPTATAASTASASATSAARTRPPDAPFSSPSSLPSSPRSVLPFPFPPTSPQRRKMPSSACRSASSFSTSFSTSHWPAPILLFIVLLLLWIICILVGVVHFQEQSKLHQTFIKPTRFNVTSSSSLLGSVFLRHRHSMTSNNNSNHATLLQETATHQYHVPSIANAAFAATHTATPSPVIHIIHSRFMQHQPGLVDLGLARLELLRIFFAQTLKRQTNKNFVLIIRTDPALHQTLKRGLLDLLDGMPFPILVVASNNMPASQYANIFTITPGESVLYGDLQSVQQYLTPSKQQQQQQQIVLETRLDADDGLHFYFVEYMQQLAQLEFIAIQQQYHQQQQHSPRPYGKDDSNTVPWRIWCAGRHIEWQYQSLESNNTSINVGSLYLLTMKDCITAGLTIGFMLPPQASTDSFTLDGIHLPVHRHTELRKVVPPCTNNSTIPGRTPRFDNCISTMRLVPAALRARTPTSAGMRNVLHTSQIDSLNAVNDVYQKNGKQQVDLQEKLWNATTIRFGMDQREAYNLHGYLEDHLPAIARDNWRGQCTQGHSCKNSSKIVLEAMMKNEIH